MVQCVEVNTSSKAIAIFNMLQSQGRKSWWTEYKYANECWYYVYYTTLHA